MTDTGDTSEVDQRLTHVWPQPAVDPLLQDLVHVANREDFEVGITLHIPGATVSGRLVGMDKWCHQAAAAYPLAAKLYEAWSSDGEEEDEVDAAIPPAHIHLVEARMLVSSNVAAEKGIFWRGRIGEVAGWTLLQFNPDGE